jgi:GNAT superfamily N-acetyltransferase
MTADVDLAAPTAADRPRPDGSDIRKITTAEIQQVARTLAHAFYDDPHSRWFVRDESKRMQRLERGFATFIRRVWLPQNEGYTLERLGGAALWMPPDTWHLGPLPQLLLLPAIVRAMRADTRRLLKALTFIEKRHPREPAHWYLPIIGVAPAWQGRGYGAALLGAMLTRCDADRVPSYLEASTPRNRVLYERNGFETVEECRYAPGGPPLWRMWREPL